MANILGAIAAAAVPSILDKFGTALTKKLQKPATAETPKPVLTAAIPAVVEAAQEAMHNSPDIAVVNVKSDWTSPTVWGSVTAIIVSVATIFLGHEIDPAVKAAIEPGLLAAAGLFFWWRHRRSTSISSSAAVNVLGKPSQ